MTKLESLRELSECATGGRWEATQRHTSSRFDTRWSVMPAGASWTKLIAFLASEHADDAHMICASVNLTRLLLSDAGLEMMAREIYEQNPIYEQPVDADFRPLTAAGAISWSMLLEYDAGLYENAFDQARAAVNALLEASDD